MPTNKFQKFTFAFITVILTVSLFVFYNLSYVNGLTMNQISNHGIPVLGFSLPLYAVWLIEFACAIALELAIGSPLSFKIACKICPPNECKPFIFETLIICSTVIIMCPLMSLIAAVIYGWTGISSLSGFIALWLKTIMHNFPLALFSQIFFIQPFVRRAFGLIFKAQLSAENELSEGVSPAIEG